MGGIAAKVVGAVLEHCMGMIGTPRSSEFDADQTIPFYWGPSQW